MEKIKVYNVGSGYLGCYYVRQLLPQIVNHWNGYYKDIKELENKPITQEKAIQRLNDIKNSDVIVFHRCDSPEMLNTMLLLKKMGKIVVFDNDDTTKIDDVSLFSAVGAMYEKYVLSACKNADLVTTSTKTLAEEYLQYNKNVVILPNCVNPNDFPKIKRNNTDKVRVGFVGSVAYESDVGNIKPVVEWLCSLPNVQVVMYSFTKDKKQKLVNEVLKKDIGFWEKLPIEWQEWTPMKDYYETLNNLRLDIMVAPRKDNYFNRCKSNLKYLEASMLEIAFIGQSFKTKDSPYDKDIIDGENGYLAQNNAEFKAKLEKMINDKELRQKLAQNAKQYVLKHYDIFDNAYKWEKTYNKLIKTI